MNENTINWFAMLDTEQVVHLGRFGSFEDADAVAPGNTIWIFGELGLKNLVQSANDALNKA